MSIDIDFIDEWIRLELARTLSEESLPVESESLPEKETGLYALFFPRKNYIYFGEAGDLQFAKADHLYALRCNNHNQIELQTAYNADPQGQVLFFFIRTDTRNQARQLLGEFLNAYQEQENLLN